MHRNNLPPLTDLIANKLPKLKDDRDKLSINKTMAYLGKCKQTLHASIWVKNQISANLARHIIARSNKKLTAEDLLPYII